VSVKVEVTPGYASEGFLVVRRSTNSKSGRLRGSAETERESVCVWLFDLGIFGESFSVLRGVVRMERVVAEVDDGLAQGWLP
jgi:hypothetical protein